MKKHLFFLTTLLMGFSGMKAQLPTYTSGGNTYYYLIKSNASGNYINDAGAGAALTQTQVPNLSASNLWYVIHSGQKNNIKSSIGNEITTSATTTSGVGASWYLNADGDYCYITSSKTLGKNTSWLVNDGGTSVQYTKYSAGDANADWLFEYVPGVLDTAVARVELANYIYECEHNLAASPTELGKYNTSSSVYTTALANATNYKYNEDHVPGTLRVALDAAISASLNMPVAGFLRVNGTLYYYDGTQLVTYPGGVVVSGDNFTEDGTNGHDGKYKGFGMTGLTLEEVTTLPVTLNAGGDGSYYATLYLPVGIVFANNDVEAFVPSMDGNQLVCTLEDGTNSVAPNTAVILKGTAASATATITSDLTTPDGQVLAGNVARTERVGTAYVFSKIGGEIGFFNYTAAYIPGFKAYLPGSALQAPSNGFVLTFNDDVTAVTSILNGQSSIVNGQYYDLTGRKVAQPQKGQIYIVNGKKLLY